MADRPSTPSPLSRVPAVEKVLQALAQPVADGPLPRPLVTEVVREELAAIRAGIRDGKEAGDFDRIVSRIRQRLESVARTRIQRVINGTGVLIHTNLGRSPLSAGAAQAVHTAAGGYCNLEFNLDTGERGRRGAYVDRVLALLCRAEAVAVVNNCAAALILILRHLAKGERNEVVLSRGELVEIGGGFRVPEILETSGAVLREVGTTNRTALADYERAIGPRTGLLLKVHRSNFYMEGFVDSPSTEDLAALAKKHGLPLVEDLGSGAMVPTESLCAIPHEPMMAEVLAKGVDLVCISGDKLLGGPQAGIIAGRAALVAGLKAEPLFRALRCDKLILAALQETADAYLRAGTEGTGGTLLTAMLSASVESDLMPRAKRLAKRLKGLDVRIASGIARCGGGTMPKAEIPSVTLDLRPAGLGVDEMARRLREGCPPVIGYAAEDALRIDLRTVLPEQDELLAECLLALVSGESRTASPAAS